MGTGKTGWSDTGDVTEITVEGNTFKKLADSTTFAGFGRGRLMRRAWTR